MKKMNIKIGEKLKKIRQERGLTQKELAEQMGYTQQYISMSEKGKISTIPALLEFCDFYNINLDYFDVRDDEKEQKENKKKYNSINEIVARLSEVEKVLGIKRNVFFQPNNKGNMVADGSTNFSIKK